MFIEMLDYGVTIDSHETVNCFRNFPDRGSIGYFSFEDAEANRNPLGNIEKYLDIIEDFISAGLIGDHYVFTNGQVSEIISEYEGWDWTPETGIVPWESEVEPELEPAIFSKLSRQERRNDKKASKRKESNKRFRDRSRKCAHERHMWKVYHRGLSGDWDVRGRRLEETGRPQSVNIHKDTKPVPEQEPTYVGFYGTLEVRKGITVTMEWDVPEAVQEELV